MVYGEKKTRRPLTNYTHLPPAIVKWVDLSGAFLYVHKKLLAFLNKLLVHWGKAHNWREKTINQGNQTAHYSISDHIAFVQCRGKTLEMLNRNVFFSDQHKKKVSVTVMVDRLTRDTGSISSQYTQLTIVNRLNMIAFQCVSQQACKLIC